MDAPTLTGLAPPRRGKVRDIYDLGCDQLLIVATDRISAYDAVLGSPVPDKGRVLTALSRFWFDFFHDVPNHVVTFDLDAMPLPTSVTAAERRWLDGRAMLAKKAEPLPAECIARGYLSGSAWREYRATGAVAGQPLPAGLREADQLPEPIFTPSTKAASGHDENIDFDALRRLVGDGRAETLRALTLSIYNRAAAFAETRGVLLADTKFEFGVADGDIIWIDEAITPDSSRFWPADAWAPGASPPSFDKQYVRDWLDNTARWNREPPAPVLPADVIAATRRRYVEAYERLAGKPFPTFTD